MIKTPLRKIKEDLENIHDTALSMETQRVNAYNRGHKDGEKNCTVCMHREQGGTDEATLKRVIDELQREFPKNKKIIEHLKRMQ